MDVRVWLFACLQMATRATISFSHFFPTLVQQIRFKDNTTVLLLTYPPYVVTFVWAICWAWVADSHQIRSMPGGVSQCCAILETILLIAVPGFWARYAFTFLASCGTFGVYATTYAWLSSAIIQPPVKRAAAIGLANICANIASLAQEDLDSADGAEVNTSTEKVMSKVKPTAVKKAASLIEKMQSGEDENQDLLRKMCHYLESTYREIKSLKETLSK
ncbi:hypothetical protein TSTA_097940 [Talaromyces stipitatus ATCC 10500]|uniref:Uncharacterized protein n=1 Tax=Talaromyces stipitatus (strain ATCC 10500 / CBS 375.48 / QM 6759 / NRRL 1006) TaxID=441959 RepID=B8MM26_TALSN|nr:uncharacterized protein TSTA_097940 [Talaromyces stipitatus ATCC 10500]EED13538.1 hypothetical protein TSTA_097940 [Talaromyces stipitatus ATCC 10500]